MSAPAHHTVTFSPRDFRAHCKKLMADIQAIPHTALAVCGKSGLAYAFGMSALGYEGDIICIRKCGETARAGWTVEESMVDSTPKILILDDLICSGDTVRWILVQLWMQGYRNYVVGIALHFNKHPATAKFLCSPNKFQDIPVWSYAHDNSK